MEWCGLGCVLETELLGGLGCSMREREAAFHSGTESVVAPFMSRDDWDANQVLS